jgi:uracil-DNA glycosylase
MNKVTEIIIKDIHPKWKVLLATPTKSGELLIDILDRTITQILSLNGKLCPDHPSKVLRCLQLDPDKIKVVIIGQDVYSQPGLATGLAFACKNDWLPSLNVLTQELQIEYLDFNIETFNGNLEHWESQGILLLNASLTCEQFKLGSHSKLWEEFFAGLLTILNDFKVTREEMTSLVFVFLGSSAQMFQLEVSEKLNYKIMKYHPTVETFGSNKFTGFYNEVNKYLEESGQTIIQWYDTVRD